MLDFHWMNIIDYVVIVTIILITIGIISVFVDGPLKKTLLILGILATGGFSLLFTYRKNKYTQEKLNKHNEEIEEFLGKISERDEKIKANNLVIADLQNKRNELVNSTHADKQELDAISKHIENKIAESGVINQRIEDREKTLSELARTRAKDTPLENINDIFRKHGYTPTRASTQILVPDPSPHGAQNTPNNTQDNNRSNIQDNTIVVNGFIMKGDA